MIQFFLKNLITNTHFSFPILFFFFFYIYVFELKNKLKYQMEFFVFKKQIIYYNGNIIFYL